MNSPIIFRYVRPLLALLIVLGIFTIVFILMFVSIPQENKEILYTILGVLIAKLGEVTGYYFGNSKDKSDADQAARSDPPSPAKTTTP